MWSVQFLDLIATVDDHLSKEGYVIASQWTPIGLT